MEPAFHPTQNSLTKLQTLANYTKEQLKGRYLTTDFTLTDKKTNTQEILDHFKKIALQFPNEEILPLAVRRIKHYLKCTGTYGSHKDQIQTLIHNLQPSPFPPRKLSEFENAEKFLKKGKWDFFFTFLGINRKTFGDADLIVEIQTLIECKSKDFEAMSDEDLNKFIKSFHAVWSILYSPPIPMLMPTSLLQAFFGHVVINNLLRIVEMPESHPILNDLAYDYTKSEFPNRDIYTASLEVQGKTFAGLFNIEFQGEKIEIKLSAYWERIFEKLFTNKHHACDFLYKCFRNGSGSEDISKSGLSYIDGLQLFLNNPDYNNRFPSLYFRLALDLVKKIKPNGLHIGLDNPLHIFYLNKIETLSISAIDEIVDFVKERMPNSLEAYFLLLNLYPMLHTSERYCEWIRNKKMLLIFQNILPGLIASAWKLGTKDFSYFLEMLARSNIKALVPLINSKIFQDRNLNDRCIFRIFHEQPNLNLILDLRLRPNTSAHLVNLLVAINAQSNITNHTLKPASYNDMVLTNSSGTKSLHVNEALFKQSFPKFNGFSEEFHDEEFEFLLQWLYVDYLHDDPVKNPPPKVNTNSENGLVDWFKAIRTAKRLGSPYLQTYIDNRFSAELKNLQLGDIRILKFKEHLTAAGLSHEVYLNTNLFSALNHLLYTSLLSEKDNKLISSEGWTNLFLLTHSSLDELGEYLYNSYSNLKSASNSESPRKRTKFLEILKVNNLRQNFPEIYLKLAADEFENPQLKLDNHQEFKSLIDHLCLLTRSAKQRLLKFVAAQTPVSKNLARALCRLYSKTCNDDFASDIANCVISSGLLKDHPEVHVSFLAYSYTRIELKDFNLFVECAISYDEPTTKAFLVEYARSTLPNTKISIKMLKTIGSKNLQLSSYFRKVLAQRDSLVWEVGSANEADLLEIIKMRITETLEEEQKFVLDLIFYPCMTPSLLQEILNQFNAIDFANFPITPCALNDLHFTCEGSERSFYMNSTVLKLKVPYFRGLLSEAFNPEQTKEIELSKEHFEFFELWLPWILKPWRELNLVVFKRATASRDALVRCFNDLILADFYNLDHLKIIDMAYFNMFKEEPTFKLQDFSTELNDYLNRTWKKNVNYLEKFKSSRVHNLLVRKRMEPYPIFSKNAQCTLT